MDAPAVSIRSSYKIEDRLRSRQPDTTASVRIHRTAKEPTIVKEQPYVLEDTIEVTDRSEATTSLNLVLKIRFVRKIN